MFLTQEWTLSNYFKEFKNLSLLSSAGATRSQTGSLCHCRPYISNGIYKLFSSPPLGGRGQGEGGVEGPLKPPLSPTLSPLRGEGV